MMQRFAASGLLAALIAVSGSACTEAAGQTSTAAGSQSSAADDKKTDVSMKRTHSENWDTISIKDSRLPLSDIGGAVLSKADGPGFTRELVRVQWRPGDPIDLYIVRPVGVASPPVILYLYNYTSEVDRFRDEGWCRRATKNGFAAVGFDSALSGQRFHAPRPMKEWFVSELQEALATSTHDVQMVLSYLATRKDLNMQKVGIFGQGSGGAVALLATAADPRIDAVDVINPWGDWPDWLKDSKQVPDSERSAYLEPSFLKSVSNLDPSNAMSSIKTASIRLQEIMEDPVTPSSARNKMMASAPPSSNVVRFETAADHAKAYRVSGLSGWLESQLADEKQKDSVKQADTQ